MERKPRLARCIIGLIAGMLALAAIAWPLQKSSAQTPASGPIVYGLTTANALVQFNSTTPGSVSAPLPITGLGVGESLVGIDVRPATGQLLGLGDSSRLYVLNTTTGAATALGSTVFTPALSGTEFGFDFNPTVDRIRVVSNSGQNLRLNPLTGGVAGNDGTLAYAAGDANAGQTPAVTAAAYTNSFVGTAATSLFVIDTALDVLALQNPPNNGTLITIGALGVDTSARASFDIVGSSNQAYALLTIGGVPSWYSINTATGAATLVGALGNTSVRSIAIAASATETIFGLTVSNKLITFSSARPGVLTNSQEITGLAAGDSLYGIDVRPANGQIYGISKQSRIYTIDPRNGVARLASTQPLSPTLSGTAFGVDFNPVADRLRVVSNNEQNLRINVDTGVAIVDGTLAFTSTGAFAGQNPAIAAAGYTNSVAGATSTALFVIDSALDTVFLQNPPNNGILTTIGATGTDLTDELGFDISPAGTALVAYSAPGASSSSLGTLNTTTGTVNSLGMIGGGELVRDITIATRVRLPVNADLIYAVTGANQLVEFTSASPGVLRSQKPITGLQPSENIAGIDFRPATGQLYALGSSSRIYRINTSTGLATAVGNAPFTPALSGTAFGFDFNPSVDRIRVVSDAEQNLRLNPVTGSVAVTDGTLAYTSTSVLAGQNPAIVAAAYTNNISGTASTSLYVIDAGVDTLALQNPPNGGVLTPIGPLGLDASLLSAFDISAGGTAYVVITSAEDSAASLGIIDLTSGRVTVIGPIGISDSIHGMAVTSHNLRYLPLIRSIP